MTHIKFVSEKYNPVEQAKVQLKWEKILERNPSPYMELEINLDHEYTNITVYIKEMPYVFQYIWKGHELYFMYQYQELLMQEIRKLSTVSYATATNQLIGFLLNQNTGCHKFNSVDAVISYIAMIQYVANNELQGVSNV